MANTKLLNVQLRVAISSVRLKRMKSKRRGTGVYIFAVLTINLTPVETQPTYTSYFLLDVSSDRRQEQNLYIVNT